MRGGGGGMFLTFKWPVTVKCDAVARVIQWHVLYCGAWHC